MKDCCVHVEEREVRKVESHLPVKERKNSIFRKRSTLLTVMQAPKLHEFKAAFMSHINTGIMCFCTFCPEEVIWLTFSHCIETFRLQGLKASFMHARQHRRVFMYQFRIFAGKNESGKMFLIVDDACV